MKIKSYTVKGVEKADITLPKEYNLDRSASLVKQAIRVYEDGTHFGLARAKTRTEVNISRKKIYKQKGTGGARHGAKSAPIFVGGGVAHGPKGVKRFLSLPIKMKRLAFLLALSKKVAAKKALVVEGLGKVKKTKEANEVIVALRKTTDVKSKILVVLSTANYASSKFFKNIEDVEVRNFNDLNAFLVVRKSLILIDSEVFELASSPKVVKEKVTKKLSK